MRSLAVKFKRKNCYVISKAGEWLRTVVIGIIIVITIPMRIGF